MLKEADMGGACGTYGGENANKVLVGKPDGMRPIEKT
jgi:hypothetical protein